MYKKRPNVILGRSPRDAGVPFSVIQFCALHTQGDKIKLRVRCRSVPKETRRIQLHVFHFPSRLQNKTKETKYQCTLDVYQVKEVDNKMNTPLLLRR